MATADYIDTQAGTTFSTANSGAVSITTAGANEVLVVSLAAEQSSAGAPSGISVSSVSDTAALTWTKRKALPFTDSGGRKFALEVWWAKKPTAGATTITVTTNVTIDDACLAVVALKSLLDPDAPWDLDASLPGQYTNATGTLVTPSATVSTQNTPLALSFSSSQGAAATSPSGYTEYENLSNTGGVASIRLRAAANAYSAPLSSQTITASSTAANPEFLLDAVVISAGSPPALGTVTAVMN